MAHRVELSNRSKSEVKHAGCTRVVKIAHPGYAKFFFLILIFSKYYAKIDIISNFEILIFNFEICKKSPFLKFSESSGIRDLQPLTVQSRRIPRIVPFLRTGKTVKVRRHFGIRKRDWSVYNLHA